MRDCQRRPFREGLDWNLFLGPTPIRAHHRKLWVKDEFKVGDLLWRGWDLYRDYSGHIMTNWGAHSVDMVQYALGKDDSGPVELQAVPLELLPEEIWADCGSTRVRHPSQTENAASGRSPCATPTGSKFSFVHGPDDTSGFTASAV